jgi:hypothetical protein
VFDHLPGWCMLWYHAFVHNEITNSELKASEETLAELRTWVSQDF